MPFLDTLRRLDAAATPGPWGVGPDAIYHGNGLHQDDAGYDERWLASPMADGEENPRSETWDEDTALLVLLRNHAARIAALVEAAAEYVKWSQGDGDLVTRTYDNLIAALAALDKESP